MIILNYTFSPNAKIEALILQIKTQEKALKSLSISQQLFEKIFKHNYLQQAYSSTKIEYSLIDYQSAQKVLHSKDARNEKERELLNVANAHLCIKSALGLRISDDFIIEIHRQISDGLKGTLTEPDYKPGQYRDVQNYLGDPFSDRVTYTFPDPKKVPKLMKSLNNFINKNDILDAVILPGIFHFIFIAIHPFVNGNGRTIRVLEDFLLKRADYNFQSLYNLSQYYYANLKKYHFFLNRGRDQNDLTDFIEFYLQGICDSQNGVFKQKILLEKIERLHSMPSWKEFDNLDKKLLNYLAANNEFTLQKAHKLISKKISDEGLRLRFQKYIALGVMKKHGAFKEAKYLWNENQTS